MIKVFLVSSVLPDNTSAGNLTLYRHLYLDPNIETVIVNNQIRQNSSGDLLRKFIGRFIKISKLRESIWHIIRGKWMDWSCGFHCVDKESAVVLTVAHGDLFSAAIRFSRKFDLPLVSIYHDYWPDLVKTFTFIKPSVDKSFRKLYKSSDVNLCVTQSMIDQLGSHRDSRVLYPIPSTERYLGSGASVFASRKLSMRVQYFGNLYEYGNIIRSAIDSFLNHPNIRLEVRGSSVNWPDGYKKDLMEKGLLLGFAPPKEFQEWLNYADAFLITSSFDKNMQRRMETSFPSKLVEATLLGKPLIIWAPAYSAAAKWGIEGDKALVVADKSSDCLRRKVEELYSDPRRMEKYAEASRFASLNEFNPNSLQEEFRNALLAAIQNHKSRTTNSNN